MEEENPGDQPLTEWERWMEEEDNVISFVWFALKQVPPSANENECPAQS